MLDLATHLASHAQVFVLAPATPTTDGREHWGEVTVIRHRYFIPRSAQRLTSGEGILATMGAVPLARVQLPWLVAAQSAAILRVIRSERIDAVNSHWLVPQGLNVAIWKRSLGVAHVATAHAADVAFLQRSLVGKRLARYIMARTDLFLPVSSYFGRVMEDLVGHELEYRVVPMGVSDSMFRPQVSGAAVRHRHLAEGEKLILFVGKLIPKKGVFYLLEAVAALRRQGRRARLLLVGGGPLEEQVRRRRADLGLDDSVELLGWVHNTELPRYYAAADVVCVPSIHDARGETEGMPVVVQEALASEAVVVATTVSGIPDVIRHGREGLLVPPADTPALTAALEAALAMPAEARQAMGEAARARALESTWARVAERYMEALGEASWRSAQRR